MNVGFVKVFHPPFLHGRAKSAVPGAGFCSLPLKETFVRSAVPWTSMSTLTDWTVPVGVTTCWPAAASVAAVKVYVAVPSLFVVGVTLLHPRKNRPVVVETLNRGAR